MRIAAEGVGHHAAIDHLHHAAFGSVYEADLVRALRAAGLVVVSLVALDGSALVGHALFSELAVEMDGRRIKAVALAPVAVRPDRQGQGIGTKLITRGLAAVRRKGYGAAIVLGHAGYYPRFGFSPALASKLSGPFRGPHFMALELMPGALAGTRGSVTYPAAFGLEGEAEPPPDAP
jgi:putative acetyltransferase